MLSVSSALTTGKGARPLAVMVPMSTTSTSNQRSVSQKCPCILLRRQWATCFLWVCQGFLPTHVSLIQSHYQLYRCYLVWAPKIAVLALPALLYVADIGNASGISPSIGTHSTTFIVTGIMAVYTLSSIRTSTVFNPEQEMISISFFFSTLALNTLCSGVSLHIVSSENKLNIHLIRTSCTPNLEDISSNPRRKNGHRSERYAHSNNWIRFVRQLCYSHVNPLTSCDCIRCIVPRCPVLWGGDLRHKLLPFQRLPWHGKSYFIVSFCFLNICWQ